MAYVTNNYDLSVYFDGLCPLCSREIEIYRRHPQSQRIRFVDIADPRFKAEAEGLDPVGIQKRFHAKTKKGEILEGVDAFVAIWKTLEMWTALQKMATSPWLRPLFDLGYSAFAKVRPLLRNQKCETDYCSTPLNFRKEGK